MARVWPDSIAGRIILVLLVGLTISHLVSVTDHYADPSVQLGVSDDAQLVERIAAASLAISRVGDADREPTAHSLSGPLLDAHWSPVSFVGHPTIPDPRLDGLHASLHRALPWGPATAVQVAYAEEAFDALREHGVRREHLISVQLPDRSWANFRTVATAPVPADSAHLLTSTTLMGLGIVLVSIVCVRLVTAPLRALAHATQRIGVDTAPIPESGPREVRQAAKALNDMQARLRKLITDRTQTLAAVSHDLRTPITRLRLRAEFVEDAAQRLKMLADLDEMEAMVASTLAFLRGDVDDEPARLVDLGSLLATICDEMGDAGHRVRLAEGGPAPLLCRSLALKRAFANLIVNAVTYGGSASVAVRADAAAVTVTIDDEGPGIPVAERARVFEPFYRLESSRSRETGGTGLGLAVAQASVRAHGGTIVLSDRPSGGLRVTVRLPMGAPVASGG